jgi:hypothetical protein
MSDKMSSYATKSENEMSFKTQVALDFTAVDEVFVSFDAGLWRTIVRDDIRFCGLQTVLFLISRVS